jgi:hypothetical protein
MTTMTCGLRQNKKNVMAGLVLCLLIGLTGTPAMAADTSGTSPSGVGLQVASWMATVPYGAAKVAYALSGSIVGGLTWAMTGGNTKAAEAVWNPSIYGDYIVQPQNLTGEKSLHFVGKT